MCGHQALWSDLGWFLQWFCCFCFGLGALVPGGAVSPDPMAEGHEMLGKIRVNTDLSRRAVCPPSSKRCHVSLVPKRPDAQAEASSGSVYSCEGGAQPPGPLQAAHWSALTWPSSRRWWS